MMVFYNTPEISTLLSSSFLQLVFLISISGHEHIAQIQPGGSGQCFIHVQEWELYMYSVATCTCMNMGDGDKMYVHFQPPFNSDETYVFFER